MVNFFCTSLAAPKALLSSPSRYSRTALGRIIGVDLSVHPVFRVAGILFLDVCHDKTGIHSKPLSVVSIGRVIIKYDD